MDNKQLLISIYQNTSTAIQSIADLLKKTNDKTFKKLLSAQSERYQNIKVEIQELAHEQDIELKDNSMFEKIKLWSGIQINTLTNDSTRHLAELMLIGTVMGTLTCYKNKVDFQHAHPKSLTLLKKLEQLEEENFKELKKYLKCN